MGWGWGFLAFIFIRMRRVTHILGLGFDAQDGHTRITQGENFRIVMGSENAHARMRNICLKMNQKLKDTGKTFHDLSPEEFADMASGIE